MDTKKLDKWAELLLDTGKRNNLVHFKDTRASTAEVLFPSPEALFEKMDGSASFEVFDPKISDTDAPDEAQTSLPELAGSGNFIGKDAFFARYSGQLRQKGKILLYGANGAPLVAVKNIHKKACEFLEETGVNVAYMAFGFIHWKESESSDAVYHAPVLLVPIRLEQNSAVEPYCIRSADEDILVNPTFSYKMDAEHGVKLPEYNDEGLTAYLDKVRHLVEKLRWTVTDTCKIGIFSFLKINMYRDLKDHAKIILANPNVRRILGESTDPEPLGGTGTAGTTVSDPLIDLHSVVDADSSQIEAIQMAKSGKSFVLQGPPGTGKSQTITNIIAECLSDGKKVLFVSEKLAALNVVYEKLRKAGLSEFCLQLHSHKANKKEVIADICHTLRAGKSAVSSKADTEIAVKERAMGQLNAYALALHRQRPGIGKSLYQLYEAHAALRSLPDVTVPFSNLSEKGEAYLSKTAPLLEQYVDYIPSVGYDYRRNPWYGYLPQDTSFQKKAEVQRDLSAAAGLLEALLPIQREIGEQYGVSCGSLAETDAWNTFFALAEDSRLLTPALLNKAQFQQARTALEELQRQSADILAARAAIDALYDGDVYFLDGAADAKKLTRQFGSVFSRLFNAEYRQIITGLRLCRKDGKKPSYKEAVAAAERLADYQQKTVEFAQTEAPVKAFLGLAYQSIETEWAAIEREMNVLSSIFAKGLSFGNLERCHDFSAQQAGFAAYHQRLDAAFARCDAGTRSRAEGYFDTSLMNVSAAAGDLVLPRLRDCLQEMDKLDNWCHFRDLLSRLDDQEVLPFLHAAMAHNMEPKFIVGAFQKQFYGQWIDSILSAEPTLSGFNRIAQDKAVGTFSEKDTEQFEINKARIRAELSAQRPSLDMIASGSALSILLREGEKKRKQKSIRTLLADTGDLVQRIKPCFLMSPLSVSSFLAPDAVHFDVVVFDEASQIFPQDAIGAIYRADQLIVVGDSRQMPPSNFFNASAETADEDEDTGDVTDFESILDLCSTAMPQLRLRWHYRSRYEQLIAFSNRNFYDGDLVTFPSAQADAPGIGVDYFHVDGIFDRKTHTNRKEAEFIVDLIFRNIQKYPDRSLGVVAFSVAQQDLIDKLLSKRRQQLPQWEPFFRQDAAEPFFIKNLETVQGDERDTILFSVAYGKDAQGRLLHNFGPLNRTGGERRLNVAVTRAKCNVQLVSSMHDTDIDLKRTSSDGARLLREFLDYAEHGAAALERSMRVRPYEQFDSDFELEVCEFLRSKGFSVDTQVGCSGFRIDLGLKRPDSSDYVLAIECDGATYHSAKNARDRDRLRQSILENMGWQFYRIWSTDWFRNKSIEQHRLLEVANSALKAPVRAAAKPPETPTAEKFEVAAAEKHFAFPPYRTADIQKLSKKYMPQNLKGMVREILKIEAPLSEELLLRRIAFCFGREKVTSVVQREYAQQMIGCERCGIPRKNGFLYRSDETAISFRGPGSIQREIRQIAPEELAAGMLEILKQNVTAEKTGLYRFLAAQCGVTRLGKAVTEAMDEALALLQDQVVIDGEQVSLK